ncbi:MAG: enoyl-CoA hydratase/isomerase family protein [Geminicoccaceae bacterium]
MSTPTPDAIEREAVSVSRPRPHVALLRLAARPLGVLRIAVKRAMLEALDAAERDPEVRALVLTGEGRAFSVGSDVREFEHDAGWLKRAEAVENELNDRIEASRLPVIAAINGHALGGGLVWRWPATCALPPKVPGSACPR